MALKTSLPTTITGTIFRFICVYIFNIFRQRVAGANPSARHTAGEELMHEVTDLSQAAGPRGVYSIQSYLHSNFYHQNCLLVLYRCLYG